MKITGLKKDDVKWLKKHFEPNISFTVGGFWFGVISQGQGLHGLETFAIKAVELKFCDRAPDDGFWFPTCYETESGCAYAILRFLEKGKHGN